MEFNNAAFIIGVNLKNLEPGPPPQTIFAEIVLLDRTHDALNPLLYELKRNEMEAEDNLASFQHYGMTSIHDDAFAMVGEVLTIDKAKRQIYLRNEITVKYKYLIIASGLKQTLSGSVHDEELSAALQALMEALRVRKNISTMFDLTKTQPLNLKPEGAHRQIKPDTRLAFQNIERILTQHIIPQSGQSLDMMLAGPERRLYELQL